MKKEINAVNNEVVVNTRLEGKTYKEVTPDMFNNKQLGKLVENFTKCENRITEDQWKGARYMGQMATIDSIKKDFGSDQAFADFMQMSRSDVNKLKRVSVLEDVAKNHGLTVSKAYELLPLIGLKDVSIAQFLIDNNVDADTTQIQLRTMVKETKAELLEDKSEITENEDAETSEESTEGESLESTSSYSKDSGNPVKYLLPFTDDNGDIKEDEFYLTEEMVTKLAKAVDKILMNIR